MVCPAWLLPRGDFRRILEEMKSVREETRNRGPVAGIVLAAGHSSRMGRPKQLLPAGGETLLQRVLREVLASGLDPVILVLGHRAGEVRESIGSLGTHPKLTVVENPRFSEGMSTSLIHGLSVVEESHDRFMVILGDMPRITSDLIDRLSRETVASGLPLGAVSVRGRRSVPVVIGRAFYGEVRNLTGDMGARSLFRSHPDLVCLVDGGDAYDASDIDTPEDYERFAREVVGGKDPGRR